MDNSVTVSRSGKVLEITLSRPKVNAIDAATSRLLGQAFLTLRDDPDLLVGIITATGEKIFSAGWDLLAASRGDLTETDDYGVGGFAGLTELFDLNKPVIAAVNGHAVGGGFELMLACDLIVASEHAEFWLPETSLGNAADAGGLQRLPKRLPYAVAMEMLLTGRRMSAGEAQRWGLINRVVAQNKVLEEARQLAEEIATGAPLSIMAIKESLRHFEDKSIAESFRILKSGALPIHRQMLTSADHEEGPQAFAEKREPRWLGR
jgi:crotonobetainyl-CoA hydratase